MKRTAQIIIATIFMLTSSLVFARSSNYIPTPSAPILESSSYVLQDNTSGKTIVAQNADERVEPASLTKMMTVYVVDNEISAGRLDPNDKVFISEKAWRTGGSRMFVQVNTHVPVKELLKGVIIQSGNDASVALAEHVAGSEEAFAELMNHHAQRLGMKNSHFSNATGLPAADHYTTANDMAILANVVINEYPESYKLYAEKTFTYNDIKQNNRNLLLWRDKSVDGIKTGHTDSAGYCLVASADRDGMRLNAIVMGAANDGARIEQAQRLLNYGFRFFQTKALLAGDQPLTEARVYSGKTNLVTAGIPKDVFVTLPQGQINFLDTEISMENNLKAPINKGQQIGTLRVTYNDDLVVEEPLVALETVEKGGLFRRLLDSIKLLFKRMFSASSKAITDRISLADNSQ
jgi:D-alanyl-D-alanine carboxypeptidase (penicillin-binding protein 5/6)